MSNSGHILMRGGKAEPNKLYRGSEAVALYLVRQVAEKLQEMYKDHMWHVSMSHDQSTVAIRCLNVSGDYGYIFHTIDLQNDNDWVLLKRGAGELLERAKLIRGTSNNKFAESLDLSEAKVKKHEDKNIVVKKVI